MKKIILLFSLLFCAVFFAQNPKIDGKWLINLTHPDIGLVTTVLEFETKENSFYAFSRKDADKLLLGNFKAPLARGMSNFKNGSLIRVEKGNYTEVNDSIKLKGVIVTAMGNYNFIGNIYKDAINVNLSRKNLITFGTIIGTRKPINLPFEDYNKLFKKAIEISKENIYKKSLFDQKDWKNFINDMNDILPDIQDDLEMVNAFYYHGNKLKTSHFALLKSNGNSKTEIEEKKKKQVILEEKSPTTAYLKIKSFEGSATEIDSIFNIIKAKNYKNLIIDLQNNSGGTVEAGMALANNVFIDSVDGGVFLTQKWFNQNDKVPSLESYIQFESFSESNFDLIISGIHNQKGLYLKVNPKSDSFKGNLYVLVNKKTASTCEPLVYELKQQKRATIVGEKTAGAMLNAEKFELFNNFYMYIPTADYYTSDSYRIEQIGVKPDIETKPEEALNKVLTELIKD